MNRFEIIFDNGGSAILQLTDGSFVHSYDDMRQLAEDVKQLENGSTTESWDGHEPECYVSDDEFNEHVDNGGYKLVDSDDLSSDNLQDICSRHGWANMLALLSPWLKKIINTGQAMPLPVDDLSHFSAKAFVQDGGLIVTVYGTSGPHERGAPANADIPLVTFGVAQRSRHGGDLWAMLLANFEHFDGIKQPSAPWLAVAVHPSAFAHRDALGWLADFERCVAWAWITRRPDLDEINKKS